LLVFLAVVLWRVSVPPPATATLHPVLPQMALPARHQSAVPTVTAPVAAQPGATPKLAPSRRQPPAVRRDSFEASVEAATADRK
jgi:hypothetical protein